MCLVAPILPFCKLEEHIFTFTDLVTCSVPLRLLRLDPCPKGFCRSETESSDLRWMPEFKLLAFKELALDLATATATHTALDPRPLMSIVESDDA